MDSPYESRRQRVAGLASNRGAAPGSDPDARQRVAIDPAWIVLTEDEQQNGLEFFAAEPPQMAPPKLEQHREYESVRAYGDGIDLPQPTVEHAKPPVQPEAQSLLAWQEPLLAVALTAVIVGYAVISVRMMGTTADSQLATLNDRIAERNKAARAVTATAAGAAIPSSGTPTASEKPASLSPAERIDGISASNISASNKVREAVVDRERAVSRAPAPPPPPISPGRDATRVRRDPPVQSAAVLSPRTAEPEPIPGPAGAPLPGNVTPPASFSVQPSPVAAIPAAPARAEASAAPLPRTPAPEAAIHTVLSQYRTAYRDLDAGAAQAVWPSVDAKALRKAFERLEEQHLIFNSCQMAVSDVRAVVSCDGSARYVPRAGNKDPHDDRRQWEFTLSKVDDVWLIDKVSAR
jgi:hypothetical protein